jgi:hypothetical protein
VELRRALPIADLMDRRPALADLAVAVRVVLAVVGAVAVDSDQVVADSEQVVAASVLEASAVASAVVVLGQAARALVRREGPGPLGRAMVQCPRRSMSVLAGWSTSSTPYWQSCMHSDSSIRRSVTIQTAARNTTWPAVHRTGQWDHRLDLAMNSSILGLRRACAAVPASGITLRGREGRGRQTAREMTIGAAMFETMTVGPAIETVTRRLATAAIGPAISE